MKTLDQIKAAYVRFLKSGLKQSNFTNDLYKAFHITSNVFIAHYDKQGFYNARFGSAEGLEQTISVLFTHGYSNDTHKMLAQVTKEYLPKLNDVRLAMMEKEITSKATELKELRAKHAHFTSVKN